jgi:N-acetylneuraminic acid mutarotase
MWCNFQTLLCIVFIVHLVPAHGAYPGAREGAVGWIENNKLWLFGGLGYAENSTFEGIDNAFFN